MAEKHDEMLKNIYTNADLLRFSKETPGVIESIKECTSETSAHIDPDRIRSSGITLVDRLMLRNAADRIPSELQAWNLYHIAMIVSGIEKLALWLNGILEDFMAGDRLRSLPAEIVHRLYAARALAIQPLSLQNPFRYAATALEVTETALQFNFRGIDFPLYCRLEGNRCHYLLMQVKGVFADNVERSLALAKQFLDLLESMPESAARMKRDIHNTMGIAYSHRPVGDQTGNLELAICHHKAALDITRSSTEAGDPAPILNNLGLMYRRRIAGDRAENIEISIAYLNEALQIHMASDRALNVAQTLTNLGVSFCERLLGERLNNLYKAIDHYRLALRYMDRDMHAGFRAWTLNNLGVVYQLLPPGRNGINQEKAIRCYRKALEFRKKESTPADWLITTYNLSKIYSSRLKGNRIRNCETAIRLLDGCLEVLPRKHSPLRWASSCACLGTIWSRRRMGDERLNLETAASYFRMALEEFHPETVPVETRESAMQLGHILMRLGRYDEAEASLRIAARADELRYRQMFMSQSRSMEIETGSEVYYLLANALARQQKNLEALEWLEKGKTRMLAERLRLDHAAFERLPASLQEEYRELTTGLQSLRIEHYGMGGDFSSVIDRTREIRNRLENLIATIRIENEGFMKDSGGLGTLLLRMAAGRCIVEFDVTAHGTVVFLIGSRDGEPAIRTAVIDTFTIDDLRRFIRNWTATGRRLNPEFSIENRDEWGRYVLRKMKTLSTRLMAPVQKMLEEECVSEIVFVPHMSLHLLPLHLMPVNEKGSGRLLIDAYTVSYLPGLTVGALDSQVPDTAGKGVFVGISNPTRDLVWADREIDGIREFFSGSPTNILKGASACRIAVTKALEPAAYIHFACHARFYETEPYRSFLALAASSDFEPVPVQTRVITHTIRSEPLYLSDIYRELRLVNHPLVVLSCCESGLIPESVNSDEFIGFAAGFLGSGARAVLSSLWMVDDQSTCGLMKAFYRNHIQLGLSVAESLRRAQLETRENPQYASPFYWAAFKVNGI